MDSWSRPGKNTPTPPPLYVTHPGTAYCHTCGRVNNTRRKPPSGPNKPSASSARSGTEGDQSQQQAKFCSERCKRRKPTTELDRKIESVLKNLLLGLDPDVLSESGTTPGSTKGKKGDSRVLIRLSQVEAFVFEARRGDDEDERGENGNTKTKKRGVPDGDVWQSVDMADGWFDRPRTDANRAGLELGFSDEEGEEDFEEGGVNLNGQDSSRTRLGDLESSGKGEETEEMLLRRREGQKRAEEREQVRQAARRAVVFGLEVPQTERLEFPKRKNKKKGNDEQDEVPSTMMRKCEAVMKCGVVDPSFAKGDWSLRWREE